MDAPRANPGGIVRDVFQSRTLSRASEFVFAKEKSCGVCEIVVVDAVLQSLVPRSQATEWREQSFGSAASGTTWLHFTYNSI